MARKKPMDSGAGYATGKKLGLAIAANARPYAIGALYA